MNTRLARVSEQAGACALPSTGRARRQKSALRHPLTDAAPAGAMSYGPRRGDQRPLCRYFAQSVCKLGKECAFRHELPPRGSVEDTARSLYAR
jgi:hypothetical protein